MGDEQVSKHEPRKGIVSEIRCGLVAVAVLAAQAQIAVMSLDTRAASGCTDNDGRVVDRSWDGQPAWRRTANGR